VHMGLALSLFTPRVAMGSSSSLANPQALTSKVDDYDKKTF
jgi:hypothetical protein